jgi:hypothetical protein
MKVVPVKVTVEKRQVKRQRGREWGHQDPIVEGAAEFENKPGWKT